VNRILISLTVSLAALAAVGAEAPKAKATNLDLAGAWADSAGAILFFHREGDEYLGTALGSDNGRETIRVRRTGPGTYKGTVEMKTGDAKARAVEIEIKVQGESLTAIRFTEKGGKVTSVARRVSSEGEAATLKPRGGERDPADICGVWRAPNGDTTRYERKDGRYVGRVAALAPEKRAYGFRIGEESVRLRRIAGGHYVGKVLVKTEGGKDAWWDDIEVTVAGDKLRYRHYLKAGGSARGTARRLPEPKAPPAKP